MDKKMCFKGAITSDVSLIYYAETLKNIPAQSTKKYLLKLSYRTGHFRSSYGYGEHLLWSEWDWHHWPGFTLT